MNQPSPPTDEEKQAVFLVVAMRCRSRFPSGDEMSKKLKQGEVSKKLKQLWASQKMNKRK